MSNNPSQAPVSVVIPAHNESKYIEAAIESVRAQTVRAAEIIVVADCCTDDTAEISRRLGCLVVEVAARNISAARNAGVRAASETWIAFLDADDYWEATKLERQWSAIEDFPEVSVVSCDYYSLSDKGALPFVSGATREKRASISSPSVRKGSAVYFPQVDGCILRWFDIGPQAVIVKRDVLQATGGFDERLEYLQDVEFFARALHDNSLVMVEEPLVYRRMRSDSHSANVEEKWSACFAIVDRMLRQPDRYVPHAGEQYREHLKSIFASNERILAQKRKQLA